MFNYEFIASLLSFTIVMVIFNLVKDFILVPYLKITDKNLLDRVNKRWYISFIIGVLLLYITYGRDGPI